METVEAAIQLLPLQGVSDKREDHLSSMFRSFSIEQIQANKRPMSGKELLDSLEQINPTLHKQVKDKCSDYPRIILSQSKSGIFKKYKKRTPTPGIDKRTLFYGLQTESYDFNEWIAFENSNKVRTETDPLLKQILPDIKRTNNDDTEAPQIINSTGFNDICNEVSFQEAKESWKFIIDTVPQDSPLWISILEAISLIDHEVLYGRDSPEYVKDIIRINSILNNNSCSDHIEKVLTCESEYRHKLFQK